MKFSSFHLGVKKLEYKREKEELSGAHSDIEKPHNTLKKERRWHKKREKNIDKQGMKIIENWTLIYSTIILCF
jgi:hypothetical protein